MRRELKRGPAARITVWAGQDGPLPLADGSVGVEYRGRIGHPSSYGLLAGRLMSDDTHSVIALGDDDPATVAPPVLGDRLFIATIEPEFEAIAPRIAADLGLQLTAMVAGEMSSSQVVFLRLAKVLHAVLVDRDLLLTDGQIWGNWDSAG